MNKPLHILLEIGSPIEMPQYPIHLDSLLYWAIKDNCDDDNVSVLARLDQILDKAHGIYKASSMRFVRSVSQGLIVKDINHPTRTHWSDWEIQLSKKASRVTTKTGGFRKRLTIKNGVLCERVEFFAVGDAAKIRYLLEVVGFIGTSNRQGFGEIININIEEVDVDQSWYSVDRELMRILPSTLFSPAYADQSYRLSMAAFAPPYHQSGQQACVFPNFLITTR